MSAALQLPIVWGTGGAEAVWREFRRNETPARQAVQVQPESRSDAPAASLAFYRKHTESLLRRYLYASMQVGRTPSILGEPVGRGWVLSRPVKTFEDAVIFVLDIEACLSQLDLCDRKLLSRIVLHEYTQAETAVLLGMSVRTVCNRFPLALDRLTEKLLVTGLLEMPGLKRLGLRSEVKKT